MNGCFFGYIRKYGPQRPLLPDMEKTYCRAQAITGVIQSPLRISLISSSLGYQLKWT